MKRKTLFNYNFIYLLMQDKREKTNLTPKIMHISRPQPDSANAFSFQHDNETDFNEGSQRRSIDGKRSQ
jgi:hypothetical protein